MKTHVLATTACAVTLLGTAAPAYASQADQPPSSHPQGTASARTSHGDPAGNNGTVKIGTVPPGTGHGNVPHPGCAFTLRFFGFDAGQTADITFRGQAPTKLGTLLTQKDVAISDDAAGGGQDADAVLTYTAAQLGLTDQPQAHQGWHVKVSVDVLQAPGGAKQKVFWLQCPQPAAKTAQLSRTSGTSTTGAAAPAAPVTATRTSQTSALAARRGSAGVAGISAALGTTSAASSSSKSPAAGGGAGRASIGGVALPFTGAETGALALAGLALVGGGTAAVALGRRRRLT